MVQKWFKRTGLLAALVVVGWTAFGLGVTDYFNNPLISVPLMAIARVLP